MLGTTRLFMSRYNYSKLATYLHNRPSWYITNWGLTRHLEVRTYLFSWIWCCLVKQHGAKRLDRFHLGLTTFWDRKRASPNKLMAYFVLNQGEHHRAEFTWKQRRQSFIIAHNLINHAHAQSQSDKLFPFYQTTKVLTYMDMHMHWIDDDCWVDSFAVVTNIGYFTCISLQLYRRFVGGLARLSYI